MSEDSGRARLGGRRGARYGAVQAIYRWLMNEVPLPQLLEEARSWPHLSRMDVAHFESLLGGVLAAREQLDQELDPMLDRPLVQLDPMEHAVLLVAAWELGHCPELPKPVVISEAVELSRTFGATEAHRFINGVLDRLARRLRPHETADHG